MLRLSSSRLLGCSIFKISSGHDVTPRLSRYLSTQNPITGTGNDRTGNDRTGNDRTGNDRTENDRTENDRTENDRTENDRTENDRTENDRISGDGNREPWLENYTRQSPLLADEAKKRIIDRMIRVDHAGELGARRIYAGQLAVLGRTSVGKVIEEMAAQELKHLNAFNTLIVNRRVRPTALLPVWHVAGYALGMGTALLGKEAAMACTVAVEEVIAEHYNDQVRTLLSWDDEEKLRTTFRQFRDEELEHKETGIEYDAKRAPFYRALSSVIKLGCRTAISISERV